MVGGALLLMPQPLVVREGCACKCFTHIEDGPQHDESYVGLHTNISKTL